MGRHRVSKVRALLFDMDGVVIHSNPLHAEAWVEYNLRHGLVTTPEMHTRISGKRNDELVRDFYGADLDADAVARHGREKEALYRVLMADRLDGAIVPGLRQFLAESGDLATALVTNAEPANVDFVLDGAGLRQWFRAIVTGEDVVRPKPFPDIYLRAAEMLAVRPAECVVFEDSPTGVAAAVAAGMRVVGIATTDARLEGAELMIADFLDPAFAVWMAIA